MILVTGATGFVGSHLLYHLLSSGERNVRALKRSSSRMDDINLVFRYYSSEAIDLLKYVEWVQADLMDEVALWDALEGVEYVFHTAAYVSFDSSKKEEILRVNQQGTANLVNIALEKKIKKLCFVSSIAALGSMPEIGSIDEETTWTPSDNHSTYSLSKFLSEMEVWRGAKEGLNCVIVNPSVIIGPGNWQKGSPRFFSTIKKGLSYYGTGSVGFVGVEDVVKAMILLMKSEVSNERFLLNSENLTYRSFLQKIAFSLNTPPPQKPLTPLIGLLAWRVSKMISLITGNQPLVTKESIATSFKNSSYNSTKFKEKFSYTFEPLDAVIARTSQLFIGEMD